MDTTEHHTYQLSDKVTRQKVALPATQKKPGSRPVSNLFNVEKQE